jgi:hypothetical protein
MHHRLPVNLRMKEQLLSALLEVMDQLRRNDGQERLAKAVRRHWILRALLERDRDGTRRKWEG